MARKRRGRGEGAIFYSESKGCWVGRAIVGVRPSGAPKYREVTARSQAEVLRKKAEAEEIHPFTPDEVRRILAAVAGHRLEALFALAVRTGMRQGELLGLGPEYVDYLRGTVRVERTLAQDDNGSPYLKEPKSKRGRR